MAPWSVWRDVRALVSTTVPVSVALGELPDWLDPDRQVPPTQAWDGISYRKLGLAGTDLDWQVHWHDVRARLDETDGPAWIAVIYADWRRASSPAPDSILELAIGDDHIAGVLVDTWDKSRPANLDEPWGSLAGRVRQAGKLLALAGGLDRRSIATLSRFAPDIVAVRGAACVDGNRRSVIDPNRVAELSRLVAKLG